ncbi:MAG TPA: DUF167 family protein [Caulobacteraceae bacterium]|nr:DUF167 family protein [Caulobacteraceae bacterium]
MVSTRLHVRLTPRGGVDRIDGWATDDAGRVLLRARVRAAAVEGEANAALVALIAKTLKISRSSVRLAGGQTARLKTIEIDADPAQIAAAFGSPEA